MRKIDALVSLWSCVTIAKRWSDNTSIVTMKTMNNKFMSPIVNYVDQLIEAVPAIHTPTIQC